jgi:hypothetical protein
VALLGWDIGQVDVACVAGPNAVAAGDGDGDRALGDLAVGMGTGFFQEIVGAARV